MPLAEPFNLLVELWQNYGVPFLFVAVLFAAATGAYMLWAKWRGK